MSGAQAALGSGKAPRRNWPLAAYGGALIAAATLLLAGEPRGSTWSVYGLACEALGLGCVMWGGRHGLARALGGLRLLSARAVTRCRVVGTAAPGAVRAAAPAAVRARARADGLGTTQWRIIRSEFTKFSSLRSSRIGPAVAVVCIVLSALFVPAARGAPGDMPQAPPLDPGVDLLVGVELAPLAVGILGVLLITSEYATGLIRYSMTVVPTRMPVLWAKLVVVVGVSAGIAVVSTPVALLVGVTQLRVQGWSVQPTDPELWVAAFHATLYMVLVGVIGLSVGTLLRTTAASISALVGIFYGVPIVVQLLPQAGARWIGRYLPAEACHAIWADPHGWDLRSRTTATILSIAWAGAAFAVASYRLLRQDV
jgi:ABC-type transport system involved in multi-copper enzyme maturation permease subunit